MEKQFTLIIPHYNIPNLLRRLLSTVPNRGDLEIIVVDDCSSKENIEELNRLEVCYPNVSFVFTDHNNGGGKARNIGLKKACGKYLFFADSDDYFTPALNEILDSFYAENKDIDMLFFNAMSVDSDSYNPCNRVEHLNNYIVDAYNNKEKAINKLKYIFGEPWCKIIKKDIVKNNTISFEEISIHNDTYFSYMSAFYAKKITVDSRVAYCVTDRPKSVSKELSEEKLLIRAEVFAKKNRFLMERDIPVFDEMMLSPLFYSKRRNRKDFTKKIFNTYLDVGFSRKQIQRKYWKYVYHVITKILKSKLKFMKI